MVQRWEALSRTLLCLLGIGLSFYALHVEHMKSNNANYKALCDISEHISCSKVFNSKYGTGFGIIAPLFGKDSPLNVPNSMVGIIFYSALCIMGMFNNKLVAQLMFVASVISCIGSAYLGYILYFVLRDICIVCISTYVLNILLLIVNVLTLWSVPLGKKKKKE